MISNCILYPFSKSVPKSIKQPIGLKMKNFPLHVINNEQSLFEKEQTNFQVLVIVLIPHDLSSL